MVQNKAKLVLNNAHRNTEFKRAYDIFYLVLLRCRTSTTASNSPMAFPAHRLCRARHAILHRRRIHCPNLFAPRRTGKTQFLVHDLAPVAERRKCTVVYASFWQTADTPVATLTHAIDGAMKITGFWQRTGSAFSGMKTTIRTSLDKRRDTARTIFTGSSMDVFEQASPVLSFREQYWAAVAWRRLP